MLLYRLLRGLFRLVMQVFFRQIEVVGTEHIPDDGAVIFAGNHPNSLIDPILIIMTAGRVVRFAAKDTLFKSRFLRSILNGLGAVPIARRDDHAGQKLDNEAAFAAMFDVLGKGGAIGIFPEGLSHDGPQLATLKTGAARLALGAAARGAKVVIVPCGLTFVNPKRFRSRVLVQYGPPVAVPAAGDARALTDTVERGLRALTINAGDWETVRTLDAVRRLYQPLDIAIDERIELARRFNTHYPAVRDDPRVVSLLDRVRAYQASLDDLAIGDRELSRDLPVAQVLARVLRYLALALLWLPLTVAGAPLHVPVLLAADFAGKRWTPRKDVLATTKVLVGLLLVMLLYAAIVATAAWLGGLVWAAAAAVFVPLSGYATLAVMERFHLLRRGLAVLVHRLRYRREVERLRGERAVLAGDVGRLVDELRPPELEPLFPRGATQ